MPRGHDRPGGHRIENDVPALGHRAEMELAVRETRERVGERGALGLRPQGAGCASTTCAASAWRKLSPRGQTRALVTHVLGFSSWPGLPSG